MSRSYGPDVDVALCAYVHESALLFGKVRAGVGASIWMNAVARGEVHEIVIGAYTNIQDFVMIHVGYQTSTIVGAYCSITHHVTLHGCTVEDNCLIGINATLMDGCVIGKNSVVAGHTIVNDGTIIPPNSIVMGTPGKVVRTRDNSAANRINALLYHQNALAYADGNYRRWSDPKVMEECAREEQRLREQLA